MTKLPSLHEPWTHLGYSLLAHITYLLPDLLPSVQSTFPLLITHSSLNPTKHLLFQADLQMLLSALDASDTMSLFCPGGTSLDSLPGRPKAHLSLPRIQHWAWHRAGAHCVLTTEGEEISSGISSEPGQARYLSTRTGSPSPRPEQLASEYLSSPTPPHPRPRQQTLLRVQPGRSCSMGPALTHSPVYLLSYTGLPVVPDTLRSRLILDRLLLDKLAIAGAPENARPTTWDQETHGGDTSQPRGG